MIKNNKYKPAYEFCLGQKLIIELDWVNHGPSVYGLTKKGKENLQFLQERQDKDAVIFEQDKLIVLDLLEKLRDDELKKDLI